MKKISRREFLKDVSTATVSAAAFGLLSGCGSGTPGATANPAASAPASGVPSFMIEPDAIPDSKISQTKTADIIVIGSGVSGLCLACRASELGASVIVFSASSAHVERGGSNHGINTKTQQEKGIDYKPKELAHRIKQEFMAAGYNVDQQKWSNWLNNNTESMNWLIKKMEGYGAGVTLELGYQDEDGLFNFKPASHNFVFPEGKSEVFHSNPFFGAAFGQALVNDMYQYEITKNHGEIDFNTTALYLIRGDKANGKEGRVTAVIAKNADGKYIKYVGNKAIVLATGDFSQNKEMMEKYCPQAVDMLTDRDVNYNAGFQFGGLYPGDGHKMGLWVGAAWQKVFPNAAMVDNLNGPYSKCISNVCTINLNADGNRYMNEDTLCSYSAWATKKQPNATAYYIWDSDYVRHYDQWATFGCTVGGDNAWNGPKPLTQEEELAAWEDGVKKGTYVKADTLKELAAKLDGLNAEQALQTIEKYNQYCADGFDPDFLKNAKELAPIKTGPFYGMKYTVGFSNFLCVTGGLRTNADMQVCDENDAPIDGLYNVGVMVGDMYANCYNFAICGHNLSSTCNTFPYMLAKKLTDKT